MAVLDITNPTLLDLAKRLDPDDKIAVIAEVLSQQNEILDDIVFVNGNQTSGHRVTIRTGLPTPTWRQLNQHVQPSKSTTAQVTFNTGMLEQWSEIDSALVKLAANPMQFRFTEDLAAIEGINQELSTTLFYGNEGTDPAAFTGLANYYNDTTAESGDNIILGGGAGADNASIFLIGWGENTIHGIVPKESKAGLDIKDLGEQTSQTTGGNMLVMRTVMQLQAGLAVKDWRYGVRIANIDKSLLLADASGTSADLPDLMFSAIELLPNLNSVKPVFYMSRQILTMLRKQLAKAVSGSTLTFEDVGGRRTAMFQDIPVRRVDSLSADEALVA